MLESMKHAADMLRRAVSAVWALCGGRERRRKKLEARILDAILANMTRNEPMHLQLKDPRHLR